MPETPHDIVDANRIEKAQKFAIVTWYLADPQIQLYVSLFRSLFMRLKVRTTICAAKAASSPSLKVLIFSNTSLNKGLGD